MRIHPALYDDPVCASKKKNATDLGCGAHCLTPVLLMGWSLSLAMIAAVLASTGGFLKYVTDKGVAQLQLETPHQQLASLLACGREPAGSYSRAILWLVRQHGAVSLRRHHPGRADIRLPAGKLYRQCQSFFDSLLSSMCVAC